MTVLLRNNTRFRIAFLSFNKADKLNSPYVQLEYYIAKFLKSLGDVDVISPSKTIEHSLFYRTKRRVYWYIVKKRYLPNRSIGFLKDAGRQIDKIISKGDRKSVV